MWPQVTPLWSHLEKCCSVTDNLLMLATGDSFKNHQLLFGTGRNTTGNLAALYITLWPSHMDLKTLGENTNLFLSVIWQQLKGVFCDLASVERCVNAVSCRENQRLNPVFPRTAPGDEAHSSYSEEENSRASFVVLLLQSCTQSVEILDLNVGLAWTRRSQMSNQQSENAFEMSNRPM